VESSNSVVGSRRQVHAAICPNASDLGGLDPSVVRGDCRLHAVDLKQSGALT